MFAFTATPEECCAADVPKTPRWHPVNCVAFFCGVNDQLVVDRENAVRGGEAIGGRDANGRVTREDLLRISPGLLKVLAAYEDHPL